MTNKEKQIKYWRERAERNFLAGEKNAYETAHDLKANYERCIKEIETKINLFYGKWASENGMTLEEAHKLLNRNELKDFKSNLDELIKEDKKQSISEEELNKLNILKAKTKISRLDELETQIRYELDKLSEVNIISVGNLLEETYEDGYYKTIYDVEQFKGFSSSFNKLNAKAVQEAVSTKYLGANYSDRIWKNQSNLMTTLQQDIPRGLTLGYNPRKLSKLVSKRLDSNYNNTVRLVRTEYNKILNDATLAGYKASGINKYQILATLDDRTSEICQDMNEKVFSIEEAETGVTLPPFHPNCRSTTIPYFEPDEIDQMSDEELENIGYITYEEWKNGLITLENGKVKYAKGLKKE